MPLRGVPFSVRKATPLDTSSRWLGYIVGVLYGDGHLNKNYFVLGARDKDFVEYFQCAMVEAGFGWRRIRKAWVTYKGERRLVWRLEAYGRRDVEQLEERFGPFTTFEWRVASSIKDLPLAFRIGLLQGFYDSEGFVALGKRGKNQVAMVGASVSNHEGLKDIAELLRDLGYRPTIFKGKKKAHPQCRMMLAKLDDVARFRERIGFRIQRKHTMLDNANLGFQRVPWTQGEDEKIMALVKQGLSYPAVSRILKGRSPASVQHRVDRLRKRMAA